MKYCSCFSPRDMGWLDSMLDEVCGNCNKTISYIPKIDKDKVKCMEKVRAGEIKNSMQYQDCLDGKKAPCEFCKENCGNDHCYTNEEK